MIHGGPGQPKSFLSISMCIIVSIAIGETLVTALRPNAWSRVTNLVHVQKEIWRETGNVTTVYETAERRIERRYLCYMRAKPGGKRKSTE